MEHPTLGSRGDLVALPLTKLDDVQLYAYDFEGPGHDIAVGPTSVVSVVGFPFGKAAGGALAIWATGFIASETDVDYNRLPLFFIDCRTRPGQSGSPVIAYRELGQTVALEDGATVVYDQAVWRLLGIYSGRINEQSDLGLVWRLQQSVTWLPRLVDPLVRGKRGGKFVAHLSRLGAGSSVLRGVSSLASMTPRRLTA